MVINEVTTMPKKYKPTFEEYELMGKQLKLLNHFLCMSDVFISNKVGKTKVDKICDLWKIEKKINQLRSQLEEMMFQDYPIQSSTHVFYGNCDELKDQVWEIFND